MRSTPRLALLSMLLALPGAALAQPTYVGDPPATAGEPVYYDPAYSGPAPGYEVRTGGGLYAPAPPQAVPPGGYGHTGSDGGGYGHAGYGQDGYQAGYAQDGYAYATQGGWRQQDYQRQVVEQRQYEQQYGYQQQYSGGHGYYGEYGGAHGGHGGYRSEDRYGASGAAYGGYAYEYSAGGGYAWTGAPAYVDDSYAYGAAGGYVASFQSGGWNAGGYIEPCDRRLRDANGRYADCPSQLTLRDNFFYSADGGVGPAGLAFGGGGGGGGYASAGAGASASASASAGASVSVRIGGRGGWKGGGGHKGCGCGGGGKGGKHH